jgi:PAS domain S-box-containing protein
MKISKPSFIQVPLLIAAIAVVIVGTWLAAWQYVQQSLIRTAGEALIVGAAEIASKFDRMIMERNDDLRVAAVAISDRMQHDPAFVQRYLEMVRAAYGMYHWIAVADREGHLTASTSAEAPLGTDVSRTPWFQEVLRARAMRGPDAGLLGGVDAFLTEEGAPDAIAISRAIYDSRGAFAGVITSRITLSILEAFAVGTLHGLRKRNSMLTDMEYQIIGSDGVAYVDSDLVHKGRSQFSTMKLRSLELAHQGQAGYVEEMDLRKQMPIITGYSLTKGWDQPDAFRWTVLLSLPTASLVQSVYEFHLKIASVGVAIVGPLFYLIILMQARWRKETQLAQTERLRARAAEAQYHLLLQTTDQGIFGVDRQGHCTFINQSAAKLLGYTPDDLLGHRFHDRVHPDDEASCSDTCVLVRALSQGRSTRLAEQAFRRKDGTVLEIECSAFPLMDHSHSTEFVFTFMDLTERKQRTKELLQYQKRLQSLAIQLRQADGLVRQRLATELHDNLAQTLALCRMKLMALSRSPASSFSAGIAPVTELLKEALTVTRQLMSDLQPPTLGDDRDLAAAVQWVTAKLQRHGLSVRVVDDGKQKNLDPDVLRVAHQSLHELLFNVLKHAQVTEATVRLRRFGGHLAIQVKDVGAGFRVDEAQAPTRDGGFGLFNLREQLGAIGGRIRLWSVPGRGSRSTMLLPLQTRSAVTTHVERQELHPAATAVTASAEARPIRIVLVDDHQIMRQGLRNMLESEPGFEVAAEAMDGEAAVELAESAHPDVILMDINMPKLNGVEATRRIKHLFPGIAVIGLSMHEDPKLKQLMHEAGASAYLSKGMAFNLVCDMIRQVWGSRHSGEARRTREADVVTGRAEQHSY